MTRTRNLAGSTEHRQLSVRVFGCCCSVCMCTNWRNGEPAQLKQNPRSRQPALATFLPATPHCLLREPWDFQHLRLRTVPGAVASAVACLPAPDAPMPAPVTTDSAAAFAASSAACPTTDGLVNWAQCDLCNKWRTIERVLAAGEAFTCRDSTAASCATPLEVGANEE